MHSMAACGSSREEELVALASCRQLVLVLAADWHSRTGELHAFARASESGASGAAANQTVACLDWQPAPLALPFPVSLGRQGLAWGRGLQRETASSTAPVKQEGDGRAPAGIFRIPALFGAEPPQGPLAQHLRMPYLASHAALKCIDDPASRYYNRIVSTDTTEADWRSQEDMLRPDARYALGAVLGQNPAPVQAGAGSCVFFHVWQEAGSPTAGCTATSLDRVEALCLWLDAAAQPLWVQLPRREYQERRLAWQLPALP